MASPSHIFLLLFPLMLLHSSVDSSDAPAPATTNANSDFDKLCQSVSDKPSCVKVIESIPGIKAQEKLSQASDYGKNAHLCLHFAATKATEAKALAGTMVAAAKGKESNCLKACAANLTSIAHVLRDLPAGQDDMNAYLTCKEFRSTFKGREPPVCEKDCWNNPSSSPDETTIADKFHDIWNVVKVANSQIEIIFPWPDE
ncbi:hypothetical protein BS78_06G059200 [Paspalum vaginatum]|nr:hypothetical protein BS78_06G059200 [Paspalum vaginatum]